MLSYDLAVLDEYEPWRIWLDEQLDLLPEAAAAASAANLWRDQNFWPDIIELATGAALRRRGFSVEFERRWGTLTPDWTVVGAQGAPVALVEVLTHSPQQATFAKMKAWHALVERLKQIPVPVVLTVAGDRTRPLEAPDARTAKKIAQDLRRALLSPLHRPSTGARAIPSCSSSTRLRDRPCAPLGCARSSSPRAKGATGLPYTQCLKICEPSESSWGRLARALRAAGLVEAATSSWLSMR